MLKVSRKKRVLYTVIEDSGKIVFWIAVAAMLFCNMIQMEGAALVCSVFMVIGLVIWLVGGNLRARLYVCPVCKRALLLKERQFASRRYLLQKLPQQCACGWRVQVEEE